MLQGCVSIGGRGNNFEIKDSYILLLEVKTGEYCKDEVWNELSSVKSSSNTQWHRYKNSIIIFESVV